MCRSLRHAKRVHLLTGRQTDLNPLKPNLHMDHPKPVINHEPNGGNGAALKECAVHLGQGPMVGTSLDMAIEERATLPPVGDPNIAIACWSHSMADHWSKTTGEHLPHLFGHWRDTAYDFEQGNLHHRQVGEGWHRVATHGGRHYKHTSRSRHNTCSGRGRQRITTCRGRHHAFSS